MNNTHKYKIPVYIIAILAGIISYLISSDYNLGFSPDSVSYFEAANSLLKANGYTDLDGNFINHWPPGYPVYIFIVSKIFGVSAMLAGTIGNAIIAFFTVLLLYPIFKSFQISDRFIYFLLILYLFSPISYIYLWYLSEALFIPFVLLSFLAFQKWMQNEYRIYLILTGLFLGLSIMVRFAGLGFVAGYLIFLLLKSRKHTVRMILWNTMTLLASFTIIVLPWVIYTKFQGVEPADRSFDFKLLPLFKIRDLFLSFGSWIFGNLQGLILIGIASIILWIIYRKKIRFSWKYAAMDEVIKNGLGLLVSISIIYAFFILFSASFLDHAIPLTNRIFSPLYPFFLCVLGLIINFFYRHTSRTLAFLIPVFILATYSFTTVPAFYHHFKSGSGFTSAKFSNSPTIHYANENLEEKIMYTNDVFLLKIFSGYKEIKLLPLAGNSNQLDEISLQISQRKAIILYLNRVNWRAYLVNKETLLKIFKTNQILKFEDGIIIAD